MDKRQPQSAASELPEVALELNPLAVIAPAQNAVVLASEIVDFLSVAMDGADLSKKPASVDTRYKFKSPDISAVERRAMFENWIFSKAFQDLLRGLKGSLEQAYIFIILLSKRHKVTSSITLDAFLAPFRREAATLHFGPLLDRVNERLKEPLPFVDAYHSLQRVRNCFEHRNGIVGEVDAPAGGVMILAFPRVKLFYLRCGEEIEIEAGHIIDAHDGEEDVQILMKIELRERRFSRYHRIDITQKDFNEIAFACNYFAEQLSQRFSALKPSVS